MSGKIQKTLLFGTGKNDVDFRCQKPCSKPRWLLKVIDRSRGNGHSCNAQYRSRWPCSVEKVDAIWLSGCLADVSAGVWFCPICGAVRRWGVLPGERTFGKTRSYCDPQLGGLGSELCATARKAKLLYLRVVGCCVTRCLCLCRFWFSIQQSLRSCPCGYHSQGSLCGGCGGSRRAGRGSESGG